MNVVRISYASIGLLAALSVSGFAENLADSSARTVTFPNQQIGQLKLTPRGPSAPSGPSAVSQVVAARGKVKIPASYDATLIVGAVDDLSSLATLPPEGLQGLELAKIHLGKDETALISRFVGLKSLNLSNCRIDPDAFDGCKSMESLRRLSVTANEKSHHTSLAKWIAGLPQLNYLYCFPALDAITLQRLDGHPSLETLTFQIDDDREAIALKVVSIPSLKHLIVRVGEAVSPRSVDRLAARRGVESLTIVGGTVDARLLHSIAQIETVSHLRFLVIKVADDFLEGLKSIQSVAKLELNLLPMDNELDFRSKLAGSLLELPKLRVWPEIARLDEPTLNAIVRRGDIEDLRIHNLAPGTSVDVLSSLGKLTRLQNLEFSSVPITDENMIFLSDLSELKSLSLVHTKVSGPGLAHLSELPKLTDLQIMVDTRRTGFDMSAISTLNRLERLQLFGIGFAPGQFYPIGDCRSLRDVAIQLGDIDDSVAKRIAKLPNLRRVNFTQSHTTDAGARQLATNLNLEEVVIAGEISLETALAFASLERLSRLYISSSRFTDEDAERLPQRFPAIANIGFRATTQ